MVEKNKNYWREPLVAFARMSSWVAIPIVAALFVGKFLDGKWGTAPWIFLGLTALAFIVSMYGILKELKAYIRNSEPNKNNNGEHNDN